MIIISHMKYPPANKCIYCDDNTGPLSQEHIIPLALGGDLIIPKASCEACRKITHKFETLCLRRMFGNFRIAANFPSRNKAARPDILTMPEIVPTGPLRDNLTIAARDYPKLLYLPNFPEPGLLVGRDTQEKIGFTLWTSVSVGDIKKVPTKQPGITGSVPIQAYCRMLAKIAHCFAFVKMIELGQENFEHLLLDYILGAVGSPFDLIGCRASPPSNFPGTLHKLETRLRRSKGIELLYVDMHLFASRGAPVYRVIAGRRAVR